MRLRLRADALAEAGGLVGDVGERGTSGGGELLQLLELRLDPAAQRVELAALELSLQVARVLVEQVAEVALLQNACTRVPQ